MANAAKIAGGALAAVALFGAGVFAANTFNDSPAAVEQPVSETIAQSDALLLQQILSNSERFGELTAEVQAGEISEQRVEDASLEMLRIGAQVEKVAGGIQNEALAEPAAALGAAYVDVGVGLVSGDSERVTQAVSDINEATDQLQAQINPEGNGGEETGGEETGGEETGGEGSE